MRRARPARLAHKAQLALLVPLVLQALRGRWVLPALLVQLARRARQASCGVYCFQFFNFEVELSTHPLCQALPALRVHLAPRVRRGLSALLVPKVLPVPRGRRVWPARLARSARLVLPVLSALWGPSVQRVWRARRALSVSSM